MESANEYGWKTTNEYGCPRFKVDCDNCDRNCENYDPELAVLLGRDLESLTAEATEDAEDWKLYSRVADEKDEEDDYWENGICDNCHFPMRAHDDGDCPSSYEGEGRFYEA